MNINTKILKLKGLSDWSALTSILLNTLYKYDDEGVLIHEPTEDEKWDLIREFRDDLLSQTDWVVVKSKEVDEPIPQKYVDYRQALRDVPQNFESADDVVFPNIKDYE